MTIQNINIGNLANDGTGDDLRTAFIKVNNNFTELGSIVSLAETEAENVGTGFGIFAQKSDNVLQLKSLQAGSKITISQTGSSLIFSGDAGLEQLLVVSDSGSIVLPGGIQVLNAHGSANIFTKVQDNNLVISVIGEGLLQLDTVPKLSANLNANSKNITGANQIVAEQFLGNIDGLVYGLDVRDLDTFIGTFDLGGIVPTAKTLLEFLLLITPFDMGTIANPYPVGIEGGTF